MDFSKLAISYLSLRFQHFTGTIPTEFGQLTSIENMLRLGGNDLEGTLPSELGLLSNIYDLYGEDNLLTGQVPSELGLLTRLGSLRLRNNGFDGSIPPEYAKMQSSLYLMNLDGNSLFTGTIPNVLCNINSTCVEDPITLCTAEEGLVFNCTDIFCGCDCTCAV